jgi:hypothetical protein
LIPLRSAFAHRRAGNLLVAAGLLGALALLVPMLISRAGGSSHGASPALASAPAGLYAVVSRPEEREDVIFAAPASAPADLREIARVPHLAGYSSLGQVSPDGQVLALVTVDAGTPGHPGASLIVVDLATGGVQRRAVDIDPLQQPAWSPDSSAVFVTRSTGSGPLQDVSILSVPAVTGDPVPSATARGVLGAYPLGFGTGGDLLYVVIDNAGSSLWQPAGKIMDLSSLITRDWRLSPDRTQLAFIEANTESGLRYRQQVVSLTRGAPAAQVADDGHQRLGVAWNPKSLEPTFGEEAGAPGAIAAQTTGGDGLFVPLGYSPRGEVLAVQAWSGSIFADAGSMQLAILDVNGSRTIPGVSRFYGWGER